MPKKKCENKGAKKPKQDEKKYICGGCGLAANTKKKLCSPKKNK